MLFGSEFRSVLFENNKLERRFQAENAFFLGEVCVSSLTSALDSKDQPASGWSPILAKIHGREL